MPHEVALKHVGTAFALQSHSLVQVIRYECSCGFVTTDFKDSRGHFAQVDKAVGGDARWIIQPHGLSRTIEGMADGVFRIEKWRCICGFQANDLKDWKAHIDVRTPVAQQVEICEAKADPHPENAFCEVKIKDETNAGGLVSKESFRVLLESDKIGFPLQSRKQKEADELELKAREVGLTIAKEFEKMAEATGDASLAEFARRGHELGTEIKDKMAWDIRIKKALSGASQAEIFPELPNEPLAKLHSHTEKGEAAQHARVHRMSAMIESYVRLKLDQVDVFQVVGRNVIMQFIEDTCSDDADGMMQDLTESDRKAFFAALKKGEQFLAKSKQALQQRVTLVSLAHSRAAELDLKCDSYAAAQRFFDAAQDKIWGPELFVDLRQALFDEFKGSQQADAAAVKAILIVLKAASDKTQQRLRFKKEAASEFSDELLALSKDEIPAQKYNLVCSVCVNNATQVWMHCTLAPSAQASQKLYGVCHDTKCQKVLRAMQCVFLTRILDESENKKTGPLSDKEKTRFQTRVQRAFKDKFGVELPVDSISSNGAIATIPEVPGRSRDEVSGLVTRIAIEEYKAILDSR